MRLKKPNSPFKPALKSSSISWAGWHDVHGVIYAKYYAISWPKIWYDSAWPQDQIDLAKKKIPCFIARSRLRIEIYTGRLANFRR